MEKVRVLVTGSLYRADLLSMFARSLGGTSFVFMEYFDVSADPRVYRPYGLLRHWHEFEHADAALDELRPEKVVMMANTSLNQLALGLAARRRGIRTIHLEHGFRFSTHESTAVEAFSMRARPASAFIRFLAGQRHVLRSHAFFARSLARFDSRTARRLLSLAAHYYTRGESPTLHRRFADLRRPDEYIEFSPGTFLFHEGLDRLDELERRPVVNFIGIPYFDDLANVEGNPQTSTVLLVDHPLHESPMHPFGWSFEFRKLWVSELVRITRKHGLRLLVKPHPIDRSDSWKAHLKAGEVELVDRSGLVEAARSVSLVLGTFSTLQLPFAAMPHVAMVVLDIHPDPSAIPGQQLVDDGVAAHARSFAELDALLSERHALHRAQRVHKSQFVEHYLHKFDGHSAERLSELLNRT